MTVQDVKFDSYDTLHSVALVRLL